MSVLLAVPLAVAPVASAQGGAAETLLHPSVFGTVTGADSGEPIAGARVWVESDSAWGYMETGEDGHYAFDFPAGEYTVSVWGDRYVNVWSPGVVFDGENAVDFALEKSLVIFGTVTDAETGEPIEGAWVEAMDVGVGEKMDWTTTWEDGSYELHGPVEGGEYGVGAHAQGYLSGSVGDVAFDGENPVEINFQLEKQLAIFGTVTDADTGEPIDAYVYANNGASASARTNSEDGYYELHLPAGEYEMRVERVGLPGAVAHVDSVVFDGENPVEINFQLETQLATIDLQHDAAGVVFDRWVTGYSTAYSGGGYVYGRWTGTELTARFTGTTIRWVGPKQPFYGMADVYIDDVLVAENVDCYAPAAEATLDALIWESGTLSDGPHTITLKLKGNRNAASTGNVVVLDRFEVDGVGPKGGGIRIDDAAAAPGYIGNWISAINPTYYDKTYSYSRWAGHVFSVTFEGTRVAWLGPMTPFYGTAEIWLDGSYVETVDAYSPTQGWRERIWESDTLSPGTHTLEIRPTGEKNPASTSANIVIDAIDVMP